MIQVQVINKINFPTINLQSTLEDIAQVIIIPDIIRGIDGSMSVLGGPQEQNEPLTRKRKGFDKPPLIDTGTLRSSFYYKTSGKNKVIITIDNMRKKIAGYLQNDGVGKKNKKYRFFGISQYAYDTSMAYAAKTVKEQISGNRSGK